MLSRARVGQASGHIPALLHACCVCLPPSLLPTCGHSCEVSDPLWAAQVAGRDAVHLRRAGPAAATTHAHSTTLPHQPPLIDCRCLQACWCCRGRPPCDTYLEEKKRSEAAEVRRLGLKVHSLRSRFSSSSLQHNGTPNVTH